MRRVFLGSENNCRQNFSPLPGQEGSDFAAMKSLLLLCFCLSPFYDQAEKIALSYSVQRVEFFLDGASVRCWPCLISQ